VTSLNAQAERRPLGSFVGRERELAELRAALEETSAHGRLFLISGEPGIGKTRLADELAAEAREHGVRVAWGRCWEGGGTPAYWPWIQVIRGCLTSLDPEQRRLVLESEIASATVHEVAKIVPELRPPSQPPRPLAAQVDPEEARFRLFDSLANLLKSFARSQPVMIVLDDLHDADLSSLEMLRFVVREIHDANILIVGTYRDAELHRSPERLRLVEEILHEGHQLPLAGLGKSEVGHMIESRTGRQASGRLEPASPPRRDRRTEQTEVWSRRDFNP